MRDRLKRYASAIIVSLVSMYCGAARFAYAEPATPSDCGLNDVFAWQLQLDAPEEEETPTYVRRVTEAFIARCPNRPETQAAHQIAGLAAGWAGLPDVSVQHFRSAGPMREADALFMAAAAEFHTGNASIAWSLRDRAIYLWTARLKRRGADVKTHAIRGGKIHAIRFAKQADGSGTTHLWLAQPNGAGWPAALSLQSRAQLNALHRLTAGEDAGPVSDIRLYRCQSRRLMARSEDVFTEDELEEMAHQSLTAYLVDPDKEAGEDFAVCLFARDMLAEPQPAAPLLTQ